MLDIRPIALSDGSVVHSDPEIMGGTPVFVGTRVPVHILIDHLKGGSTIDTPPFDGRIWLAEP